MSKWISCKDRVPEIGIPVLCTVQKECEYYDPVELGATYQVMDSYVVEGFYERIGKRKKVWMVKTDPDTFKGADVIAWMPLPKPYEE